MAEQGFSIVGTLDDQISSKARGIAKLFAAFEGSFKKLDSIIAPLTGRVTAFVAALGGAAVFRDALRAAEEQAQAEARLLNALRGRQGALTDIKKSTDALQKSTIIADEKYIDFAATLVNVGLAAEDVDDALRAIANTTAALGTSPEQIIRAISAARRGEVGRIAQLVPELQAVVDAGGNARDVIDELNRRFAGAAEALAATPFGQKATELNLIGEASEALGNSLIRLQVAALKAVRQGFDALSKALNTATVQGFLKILEELAPAITEVAFQVAVLATAISGLRLASFLAPVLAVAIPLGPAIAVIAAGIVAVKSGALDAVAALFDLGEAGDAAAESIERTRSEFSDLLREIAAGRLTSQAFFDRLELQARNVITLIKAIFVQEFNAIVAELPNILRGVGKLLTPVFTELGVGVIDSLQTILFGIVKLLAAGIDGVVNATVEALPKKVTDALGLAKIDLAGKVSLTPLKFDDVIDLGRIAGAQGLDDIAAALERASSAAREGLGPALDEIALRNADFEASLERQRKAIVANTTERNKEAAALTKNLGILREDVDAQLLSAEQAREGTLLREGSLGQLQQELAFQEAVTVENRAQVDALLSKRADLAEQESQQAQTLQLLKEQQETEAALLEAAKALAESEKNRANTLASIATLREKEGSEIVATAEAERKRLDATLQSIQAQRSAGAITQGQALELSTQATTAFEQKLIDSKAALEQLLATLPPEKAAELSGSLATLGQGLVPEGQVGFFDGIVQGAEKATVALDDMGQVGISVGEQLTDSLASGLADVFVKGETSLRQFLGTFLQTIAIMITKLLILKAIQTALGGYGAVAGAIAGANRGGLVMGFAGGGSVPGPNVDRDVVPAVLTPGEFVQTRDATAYYGVSVMEAMRRMLVPRSMFSGVPSVGSHAQVRRGFADGGPVTSGQTGAAVMGGSTAMVLANEQTLDRLIAGGEPAFIRALERNADVINALRQGSR